MKIAFDCQSPQYLRVGAICPLKEDRASGRWRTVRFSPPFPEEMAVVVIPMTQTYNGPETPGLRIRDVDFDHFQIRFDEVVIKTGSTGSADYSANGAHGDETVGWVAYGFIPKQSPD